MASSEEIADVTKQLAGTKVDASKELSFKGKSLKLDKASDAEDIIKAIKECKDMKSLRLEGNTLGVEAAKVLAESLESHPELERALWGDMFTGRLKSEIPEALKYLGAAMTKAGAQLVELDLSDNALGPNGVKGIVDLLSSKTCYTLQELRLNNNGLGTTGGQMLAGCLLDCYNSSKAAGRPLALKVFVSGRGRLENEGSTALSEVFKLMGSLEEVSMPQNGINHEGIAALAEAFEHNPNLRLLNLNDNTLTAKGARSIAKALPKLQNLEVINFGDCLIRTDGARSIGKALRAGHKKLRELYLSGNEIGKAGAVVIAEATENKDALEKLDLDSNMIGEDGIETLRATLEPIGKLEILETLSGDEGSDDEEDEEQYDNDEDEGVEEDVDGDQVDDPHLQVKGTALSPKQDAQDFLCFPSPTKLQSIGSKQLTMSVKEKIGSDITDAETVIQNLVRISTVLTEDDKKGQMAVFECSDSLLQELFKAGDDYTGPLMANAYLVQIGLLKGEDKKYKAPSDITGPLILLNHIVQQQYCPRSAKKIFSAFMDKPHPQLDKSLDIRSKILQTLYTSC